MVTQSANVPRPPISMPQRSPDRAVRAVGGDQVVGADGLLGAAVPGAEDRRDPVVVLLEGDQLGGVGVLGAALLGRPAQQRLQPDLGDEQPRRGAQCLNALVEVPEEELHLRAGQAFHGDDGAVLHELLCRRGLDLPLQPHTAEDLHGPLVERGGPGWTAVPRCRSTSRCGTSWAASSNDVDSPTRLPPTISTGTWRSLIETSPRASDGHGHSSRVAARRRRWGHPGGWAEGVSRVTKAPGFARRVRAGGVSGRWWCLLPRRQDRTDVREARVRLIRSGHGQGAAR